MPANTESSLESVPPELLHFVLGVHRPVYDAEKIEKIPTRKAKVPIEWTVYASQLQFFAQLRLVCKSWYHFITPLLYSTFTLPTHPHEQLERVSKGLTYYPELIDRLVLRGHTGGAEEQQEAKLLAACLSQCTNIHTLEILDAHRIFRSSRKSKCLAIFRALPSSTPLTSLILRFPHTNTQFTYPISTTLLGLSSFIPNLKTLELHEASTYWSPSKNATLDLPSCLPSLEKLVIRSIGLEEGELLKLTSRIYQKHPCSTDITSPNALSTSPKRARTIPLRDLTLCWNRTDSGAQFIADLVQANDLGRNLTALSVHTLRSAFGQESMLPTLPGMLVTACPHLETFCYYIKCPDSIFTILPRTIKVLGLALIYDYKYYPHLWASAESVSETNYGALLDWLEKVNGRVKKLFIQHNARYPQHIETIQKACEVANVEASFESFQVTY